MLETEVHQNNRKVDTVKELPECTDNLSDVFHSLVFLRDLRGRHEAGISQRVSFGAAVSSTTGHYRHAQHHALCHYPEGKATFNLTCAAHIRFLPTRTNSPIPFLFQAAIWW